MLMNYLSNHRMTSLRRFFGIELKVYVYFCLSLLNNNRVAHFPNVFLQKPMEMQRLISEVRPVPSVEKIIGKPDASPPSVPIFPESMERTVEETPARRKFAAQIISSPAEHALETVPLEPASELAPAQEDSLDDRRARIRARLLARQQEEAAQSNKNASVSMSLYAEPPKTVETVVEGVKFRLPTSASIATTAPAAERRKFSAVIIEQSTEIKDVSSSLDSTLEQPTSSVLTSSVTESTTALTTTSTDTTSFPTTVTPSTSTTQSTATVAAKPVISPPTPVLTAGPRGLGIRYKRKDTRTITTAPDAGVGMGIGGGVEATVHVSEQEVEERVMESKRLVQELIAGADVAAEDGLEDADERKRPDDADPATEEEKKEAFRLWELRELRRLQRDLKEKQEEEAEEREKLRRRNLTTEELERENAELEKLGLRKPKEGEKEQWNFLQKYYHKGVFFMDEESIQDPNDVRLRSAAVATGIDAVNKMKLPEIMQVRDFGKKGKSKWTHLAKEDTSQFDDYYKQVYRNMEHIPAKTRGGMKDL